MGGLKASIQVCPDPMEVTLNPGEGKTLSFKLSNDGEPTLKVMMGATGMSEGTSIFLHQTRVSVNAREKKSVSFSLEMDPGVTSKQTFRIVPQMHLSTFDAKCIIKIIAVKDTKRKLSQAGNVSSEYVNVSVFGVTGKQYPFTLKTSARMSTLMKAYRLKAKIPEIDQLRFMFDGRRLEDSRRASDYAFKPNSAIEVLMCLCGC